MVFFMAYAICLTVEVPLLNLERLLMRPNQTKSNTYLNLCMSYFLKYFFEQEKQLLFKRRYQTFTRVAFDLNGFFLPKNSKINRNEDVVPLIVDAVVIHAKSFN